MTEVAVADESAPQLSDGGSVSTKDFASSVANLVAVVSALLLPTIYLSNSFAPWETAKRAVLISAVPLGAGHMAVGEPAKAKIMAQRALALQGNHVLALNTLATVYESEGDVVNARLQTERLCGMSTAFNICSEFSDAELP